MSNRGTARGGGRGRGRGSTFDVTHQRGGARGRGGLQIVVFEPEPSYPAQIDPKVKRTEQAMESSINQSKSKKTQFPERPGFGTQGKETLLWTNYLELTGFGDLVLYRYSIAVTPDRNGKTPSGKKLKRIIQILLDENLSEYSLNTVTDFKSNILCKQLLELREHYDVAYRSEEEDSTPSAKAVAVEEQRPARDYPYLPRRCV